MNPTTKLTHPIQPSTNGGGSPTTSSNSIFTAATLRPGRFQASRVATVSRQPCICAPADRSRDAKGCSTLQQRHQRHHDVITTPSTTSSTNAVVNSIVDDISIVRTNPATGVPGLGPYEGLTRTTTELVRRRGDRPERGLGAGAPTLSIG